MNYASILKSDIANSDSGFTCSLFVSGCARKCPGCFNQQAQDPSYGKPFDDKAKTKIFDELNKPYCRGLSLLGGDPMSKLSDNRETIIKLTREVKEKFPDKIIYLWTGYTIEEIESDPSMKEIINYIDVMIDGPFIEDLKDPSLVLRGSSNQRIINISEYKKTKVYN